MSFRTTVLFVTLLSGAAQGAVVHRCRLADGGIVFRDTTCALGESLVSRTEYAEPPAAEALARAEKPARKAHRESPRATRGEARAQPRDDRIVAHECRFGDQRWVQAEACPAKMAGKQTVHETRLSKADVCGALRHLSAAASPGEGSARRAYGMNRLRQRHGC